MATGVFYYRKAGNMEKLGFMSLYLPENLIINLRIQAAKRNQSRNQFAGNVLKEYLRKLELEENEANGNDRIKRKST
jgi:hypothetical protein